MTTTCWDLTDAAAQNATRILLYGPRGVGKSKWAQDMLRTTHKEISQCSLNEDIAMQELLGHYVPKGTNFEWHDGPVMTAYRGGHGLVVNEMGRASGAVQDMFLAVMDDASVSMISLPTGENVKPGNKFQVVATSNASPESMDEALQDRFDCIIPINQPHPGLISHIDGLCEGLGEIIQRSYQDAQRSISPRRALAYISFTTGGMKEDIAAQLAFGARAKDILVALKANAKTKR
jgi:MoxR-like ATPase